jgi:tRNA dimethylallyltransferase
MQRQDVIDQCAQDLTKPVLIAGPTASGKSALALAIAADQDRTIVNADAIQVFENWRILTARPSKADEAAAPHALYGHVPGDQDYSVGTWLREVKPFLDETPAPIIIGGTGLYFTALTQGLANIPATPPEIRAEATSRMEAGDLENMIAELDPESRARIDTRNPMRVQRAWEVLRATGRGIAEWQDTTAPPLVSLSRTFAFVVEAPKEWLTPRIEARFSAMLREGALEEAQANLETWNPKHPSAKAIGAAELIALVSGDITKETAETRATIATRQFAKRQRTWFRARMTDWTQIFASEL